MSYFFSSSFRQDCTLLTLFHPILCLFVHILSILAFNEFWSGLLDFILNSCVLLSPTGFGSRIWLQITNGLQLDSEWALGMHHNQRYSSQASLFNFQEKYTSHAHWLLPIGQNEPHRSRQYYGFALDDICSFYPVRIKYCNLSWFILLN